MSTAHPPMRPSSRPPSKVPTMPPTKSLIPPVPFLTSSPCSHWSSSEFAERSPHHGPFHSQSSVLSVLHSPIELPPTFDQDRPLWLNLPPCQEPPTSTTTVFVPSCPPARLPVAFLRSPAPTVFPVLLAWDNNSFAIVLSTRFGSTPRPSPAPSPLTTGRVVSTLSWFSL